MLHLCVLKQVAYNLTTVKEARCLNNCTGHGTCSEDAVCHCEVGDLAHSVS